MLKYQKIAIEIEEYIENNQLQQGNKLPVLETLMTQFDVSKSTIIKALEVLEKKGLIFQVRGSGIFVRRLRRKGYINLLTNQGFKKDLDDFSITSKVVELDVKKASSEVAHNLNIELNSEVYYVKRIRYINGQTLCLEESYIDKAIIPYLNKEIATESIFNYIREALGLKIGFSDSYLYVDVLNQEEAKFLNLKSGLPKLYVENIFYLTNGQSFNFSKVNYNYEQSQFFIQANGYYL